MGIAHLGTGAGGGMTQRLIRAFEKLQGEGPAASIQGVSLACGYRQISQFSTEGDQGQGW